MFERTRVYINLREIYSTELTEVRQQLLTDKPTHVKDKRVRKAIRRIKRLPNCRAFRLRAAGALRNK